MIVGIDEHRERVGEARDGMRGLEHLAGVKRVEVGVVVLEAGGGGVEDFSDSGGAGGLRFERREIGEAGVEILGGVDQSVEGVEVELHGGVEFCAPVD